MKVIINYDIKSFDPSLLSAIVKDYCVVNYNQFDASNFFTSDVVGVICRLGFNFNYNYFQKYLNIRFLATITTGLDHIDLDYCNSHSIEVISLKGETKFLEGITATPELTWGLLLSLIRKIPAANNSVLSGEWNRNQFFGKTLKGKTIGIVGFGRIGKNVAKFASCFDMKVNVCDVIEIDFGDKPYIQKTISELMGSSDFVSIHVPYDKSTHQLISADLLARMKKGSYLINTSRGGIIDENALLMELKSGRLAGVGLDVLSNEVLTGINKDNPLITYANEGGNIVFTPHIGGSTCEALSDTSEFISKKILNFLGYGKL